MRIPTKFVAVFLLCFVGRSLCKPTSESDLTTGRGIGSTLWGWITYPFSWWSSEPELPPVNEQLIGSTTPSNGPLDSIEVGKHNVTVWCNDQTCTTMKCDQFKCRNVTCNIYDTDMMGECREYNIAATLEERPNPAKPTEPVPKPVAEKVTESATKAPAATVAAPVSTPKDEPPIEEHPLDLEAVLSSTVNKDAAISPTDKIELNPNQKV